MPVDGVLLVVEAGQIVAARVAIDERAFEALLPDTAIQFIGRLLGGRDRQRGKGRKARWILLHRVRKEIVRLSGDGELLRHVCLFDPGSIQREHLQVDTGGIHLSHAPAATQPPEGAAPRGQEAGIPI